MAAGAFITPEQIVAVTSKATGKKVTYQQIPDDVFASKLPPGMQDEMKENMILMREYQYYGPGAKEGIEEANAMLSVID